MMDSQLASPALPAQFAEQRRGTRLLVAVPVILAGKDAAGRKFREETRTLSINRTGAAIETSRSIAPGVELLIKNAPMGVTVRARALRWRRRDAELPFLAVELIDVKNVWGIQYPPADWRLALARAAAPIPPKVVEIDLSGPLDFPCEAMPSPGAARGSTPSLPQSPGSRRQRPDSDFAGEIMDAAKAARDLSARLESLLDPGQVEQGEEGLAAAARDLILKFTLHLESFNQRLAL